MNAATHHRMSEKRPEVGQRVRAFIYNFAGVEIVDGAYSEKNGQPMIGETKIHRMRTEWRPEIVILNA